MLDDHAVATTRGRIDDEGDHAIGRREHGSAQPLAEVHAGMAVLAREHICPDVGAVARQDDHLVRRGGGRADAQGDDEGRREGDPEDESRPGHPIEV
jgi:hypothetical protein